ncbi:mitochondrial carrier domain-containing protein [Mycena floridula]|nr:mitochondrial carrier domain-containing protein [Mycena floridula]
MSSLRDLYSDTSSTWAFVPPSSPSSSVNATVNAAPVAPAFRWSNRPAHNSIFDLSPDLNEGGGIDAVDILKALAASTILQYTSTAIAMPWEVGKLLLQVQWVPRDIPVPGVEPEPDFDDSGSDSSNDNERESYFADPEGTPRIPQGHLDQRRVPPSLSQQQTIISDNVIPVGSADSVWGMIKHIGRFRPEGWLALWKGLLTSCISEVVSSTLQPIIHSLLQALLSPTTSLFHCPPILLPMASHIITGFIVSPLDLIRTRLIVQSFSQPTYKGPFDALTKIIKEEGGLKGIYLHPELLIPTLIDSTLRPIVSLALPGLLVAYLGAHITMDANPIAWGLAELAGSCIGLLITLPFETVRRRLQAQVRGTTKPLSTCVGIRPTPYVGVVDAVWHILTEERSDLPLTRRTKRRRMSLKGKEREVTIEEEEETWMKHTGIGQLYRGLGMRLSASAIVFLLAFISGEDADGGWAEL